MNLSVGTSPSLQGSASVTSAAAGALEEPQLDPESVSHKDQSDRTHMDVLRMEMSIEQNLSKAMSGLCDQFSQQLVSQSRVQPEWHQGSANRLSQTVPIQHTGIADQKVLIQLPTQQDNDGVSGVRMEVDSLRRDLHKISGHASSSADCEVANTIVDKVCRDMQVHFSAFQARISSEVCNSVGQLRGELGLVKADVARTSECLQHVEGEVRSLRARLANEQLTARLTAVEEEVRRSSKTLSHVGDILNVTHEITTGSDKMLGRMSHEVAHWREAEGRLEKRLLAVEQMLHRLGSFAVKNAEQQFEMRQPHEPEQTDMGLPRSADLRLNLESLIGKMNETLQAPQPKRTSVTAAGFEQRSPQPASRQGSILLHGSSSPPILSAGIASQRQTNVPSSVDSLVQRARVSSVTAGESAVFAVSSPAQTVRRQVPLDASRQLSAGIHPHGTSAGGYYVGSRQTALSGTPAVHQAQQPS